MTDFTKQENVAAALGLPETKTVTRCFTFGFGHKHPHGFVRITAETASACRAEMFRRYGRKWAFEYSEDQIAAQMKRFPMMYEVKEEEELELAQCFTCCQVGANVAPCTVCGEPLCTDCIDAGRHKHEEVANAL